MLKSIKRIVPKKENTTDFSSVLNRVYANRNVKSEDELNYSISKLLPFNKLKGIKNPNINIKESLG